MKDLSGRKYGRLTCLIPVLIGEYPKIRDYWVCKCECGRFKVVQRNNLTSGNSKSCGCWKLELQTKHNHSGHAKRKPSPEYISWIQMHARIRGYWPESNKYYSDRGITICERWNDFRNFLADMGKRPHKHTLDRINNDGNYEPSNCRWATYSQQNKNRRTRKQVLTDSGEYNKNTKL